MASDGAGTGRSVSWSDRSSLQGLRHFWKAFAGKVTATGAPMLYSQHRHYWYAADYSWISIPWAVTDDFGNLVAVPGPAGSLGIA